MPATGKFPRLLDVSMSYHPVRCHLPWLSPELLVEAAFDEKTDAYSFGMLLWAMLAGQPPFAEHNVSSEFPDKRKELVGKIVGGERPPIDPSWAPCVHRLLVLCWALAPEERPSIAQIQLALTRLCGRLSCSFICVLTVSADVSRGDEMDAMGLLDSVVMAYASNEPRTMESARDALTALHSWHDPPAQIPWEDVALSSTLDQEVCPAVWRGSVSVCVRQFEGPAMADFSREADLLAGVQHAQLCHLYGTSLSDGLPLRGRLVLEMTSHSFLDVVQSNLLWREKICIAKDLIGLVEFLRQQSIAMLTMCPTDLRFAYDAASPGASSEPRVRLVSMQSCFVDSSSVLCPTLTHATLWWAAPEVLAGSPRITASSSAITFSLGMLMWLLATDACSQPWDLHRSGLPPGATSVEAQRAWLLALITKQKQRPALPDHLTSYSNPSYINNFITIIKESWAEKPDSRTGLVSMLHRLDNQTPERSQVSPWFEFT